MDRIDSQYLNSSLSLYFDKLDDDALKNRAQDVSARVVDIVRDYEAEATKVRAIYLPAVVDLELNKIAATARERVRAISTDLADELRATEEALRLSLAPQPPKRSVEMNILLVERRALLRALPDRLSRMDVLRQAVDIGDRLTVDAAVMAPPFEHLVDPEQLRRLLEEGSVREFPEAAQRLQTVTKIRTGLDSAIDGAYRAIPATIEDHISIIE